MTASGEQSRNSHGAATTVVCLCHNNQSLAPSCSNALPVSIARLLWTCMYMSACGTVTTTARDDADICDADIAQHTHDFSQ